MNRPNHTILITGTLTGLFGTGAGIAEIVAGTVSWAGNKNDPTTLGWITIGLGTVAFVAAVIADRSRRPGVMLPCAAVLFTCALVGATTAGIVGIPAALLALVTAGLVSGPMIRQGTWRTSIRLHWASTMVAVLAVINLAFGVLTRNRLGILGVAGALLAWAVLTLPRRRRVLAATGLVVGVVPFAIATAWTVITPLTAVLMLVIGLPHLLGNPRELRAGGSPS